MVLVQGAVLENKIRNRILYDIKNYKELGKFDKFALFFLLHTPSYLTL